jgi:hypothetical protein
VNGAAQNWQATAEPLSRAWASRGSKVRVCAAWILLFLRARARGPVKSFSLRLVSLVWLMAALSMVGWLVVNLDTVGWILIAVTTGLMTFELTRRPAGPAGRTSPSRRHDEPPD